MCYFSERQLRYFGGFLVAVWAIFLLARPINLMVADLGRHLQNGRVIVNSVLDGDASARNAVLHTNFYSHTLSLFPFINHHWGSGVVFYAVFMAGGFTALSLFFILLSLVTLCLFFTAGLRGSNFFVVIISSVWLVPLLADRTEIRPEIFSYFFLALFFTLLWRHTRGQLRRHWLLYLLPILQLVWANVHVYFFLGLVSIGSFFIEAWFERPRDLVKVKFLGKVGFLSIVAACITPFGLRGLLYPLAIFKNYGYTVLENQSLFTLVKNGLTYPNIIIFCLTAVVLIVGYASIIFRQPRYFFRAEVLLVCVVLVAGFFAVRNLALLGFFGVALLPLLAAEVKKTFFPQRNFSKKWLVIAGTAVFFLTIGCNWGRLSIHAKNFGVGLAPGVARAAEFMQTQGMDGSLFNNFDSGGYLIWSLHPTIKVFVDNRPEAYPAPFFTERYIPMQSDDETWKKELSVEDFDTIFFSLSESTPWGQRFLVNRVQDPAWAPVYLDAYALIFLRRTPENAAVINEHEVSPDRFGITGD